MTVSDAKHAANIANAQHSTGPSSKAGKAASSRNAVTHGLTAQNIIPRTEEETIEFAEIHRQTSEEVQPVGLTETLLADRVIHARCCLARVTRLLGELETGSLDDVLDPEYAKPIARLNRYYSMHERSLYRALQTLKAEQTNRGLREAALGLSSAFPPLADAAKILKALKQRNRAAAPKGSARPEPLPSDPADPADDEQFAREFLERMYGTEAHPRS